MTTITRPQFADQVDREPTESTQMAVEWLREHTGYDVDPVTVKLVRALNATFQRSDVNQKRMAQAKANAAAKRAPAAKKKAEPQKPAAKKAAPAKKAPPTKQQTDKPATGSASAPAKKAPAKAPAKQRRSAPRKAPATPVK